MSTHGVTTWTVEPLRTTTRREARQLEWARSSAQDQLAGRTVWCVSGLPAGRESASALRASLHFVVGESGVAVGCLEIRGSEPLTDLGRRLEAMLHGFAGELRRLSAQDGADYADACRDGEVKIEGAVAADDVVVLHDAVAGVAAQAARERGAHVIWRIDSAPVRARRGATDAWAVMRPHEHGVDGYIGEWLQPGAAPGRIGVAVPSTGVAAAREVGEHHTSIGWSSALADVVGSDRHELVGGTVRARPAVAIR
jgi:hypothetical protein